MATLSKSRTSPKGGEAKAFQAGFPIPHPGVSQAQHSSQEVVHSYSLTHEASPQCRALQRHLVLRVFCCIAIFSKASLGDREHHNSGNSGQ